MKQFLENKAEELLKNQFKKVEIRGKIYSLIVDLNGYRYLITNHENLKSRYIKEGYLDGNTLKKIMKNKNLQLDNIYLNDFNNYLYYCFTKK